MCRMGIFFCAIALVLFSCQVSLAAIQFTDPDPDPAAHGVTTPTETYPYYSVQAGSVTIDIDGDGVNDFTFSTGYHTAQTGAWVNAAISGLNGAQVARVLPGGYYNTSNISANSPVDGSLSYGSSARVLETNYNWQPYHFNYGYMGFTLSKPDGLHYGWMEVDATNYNSSNADVYINSWAFETNPNTTILASAVPEPATLALLAVGGAAMLRRRRR